MVTKRPDRRKEKSGAKKIGAARKGVKKVTFFLRRDQDRMVERIKLYYRDRSTPQIDKSDLMQKAVDLLVAEFNKDKDFLLAQEK